MTKISNFCWETWLGVDTRGRRDVDFQDAKHYASCSYPFIRRVLTNLHLGSGDVFVDLGCGKGRVVCLAARVPIAEVIGIEIDEELCNYARANSARMRGRRAPITIENLPVQDFSYDRGNVFYMFEAFGGDTLRAVCERLRYVNETEGRHMRFAYVNGSREDILEGLDWLNRTETWEASDLPHRVSFWSTSPATVLS